MLWGPWCVSVHTCTQAPREKNVLPCTLTLGREGMTCSVQQDVEWKGLFLNSESTPWDTFPFPFTGWEQPTFPEKSRCQLASGLQPAHVDQSSPLTCRQTHRQLSLRADVVLWGDR